MINEILWIILILTAYSLIKNRKAIWKRMNYLGELYADYIRNMIEVNRKKK